jgi:hypothetical protein
MWITQIIGLMQNAALLRLLSQSWSATLRS